ncbi:MAG: VOC family protein [Proteobacteria bacterium]|nr:VOC family protein [Pseudomonadota bacterium]
MSQLNCGIDHLLWGVPHLGEAIASFEALSGIRATPGGEHPELGTHNALLSLGKRCYLEIISARPNARCHDNPLLKTLQRLSAPALIAFAANATDLGPVATAIGAMGYTSQGPFPGSRQTPAGPLVHWKTLMTGGHPFAQAMPFFIDWLDTPHPQTTSAAGACLERLFLVSPEGNALAAVMQQLGLDVRVRSGPATALVAEINTPRGILMLTG